MTESQYRNFARKYRPETFAEMAGQEHVTKTLCNSLKLGRVAHAYLFYGPRGCGKTTAARVLAKALNCQSNDGKPAPEPCCKCRPCQEIAAGADMDVLEMDAASHTQVEKIREVILDTVSLSPARDRYKVFILDEVHMLSASSFNALLKTVEEPPPHVVFILATTERHKVPATIISRCQSFRIRPFMPEAIAEHLARIAAAEKIDISRDALAFIARSAGGVMRDAHSLLDRAVSHCAGKIEAADVSEMLGAAPEELIGQAVSAVLARDGAALHAVFRKANTEGFEPAALLRDIRNGFASMFFCRIDPAAQEPFPGAAELAKSRQSAELASLARRIGRLADEIRFSDTQAVAAEVGLFTLLESVPDIDGFVRRLESLESRLSGEAAAPPRPVLPAAAKAETAAAPQPRPSAAAQPETLPEPARKSVLPQKPAQAAPPAPSEPDGVVWKKLLDSLARKRPMLHDLLKSASVEFSAQAWTVSVPGNFAYQSAGRNAAAVSAELEAVSGRHIKLLFHEAPAQEPPPDGGETAPADSISDEDSLAGAAWQDINSASAPQDAAVRKVVKLFNGKVIKK
ncbi:MAG: DNA polymerase III subunit gamma/tau [Elusimicrobiales bacterium]